MTKKLQQQTKFLVAMELIGDHGEDEGFEYKAIYDKQEDAYNYIVHSPSFRYLRVIELPLNLIPEPKVYAKKGVQVCYNLKTKVSSCYKPNLHALDQFYKPKCALHHFFPFYEVSCVVDIDTEDKVSKAIETINQHQNQLLDSIVEVFNRILRGFVNLNVLSVKPNYQTCEVEINIFELPDKVIVPNEIPAPSDYNQVSIAFKTFQNKFDNQTVVDVDYLIIYNRLCELFVKI